MSKKRPIIIQYFDFASSRTPLQINRASNAQSAIARSTQHLLAERYANAQIAEVYDSSHGKLLAQLSILRGKRTISILYRAEVLTK